MEKRRAEGECAYLFVLELDNFIIAPNDFISFVLGSFEKFWEREPLSSHLIPVPNHTYQRGFRYHISTNHFQVSQKIKSKSQAPRVRRRQNIPIISINKLIIIHAIRCIPLHPLDSRLHRIKRNDIIYQRLSRLVQWKRFRRIRVPVFGRRGLTHFELLAWRFARLRERSCGGRHSEVG